MRRVNPLYFRSIAPLVAVVIAAAACTPAENERAEIAVDTGAVAAPLPPDTMAAAGTWATDTALPSEANIAAILTAANQREIQPSQLAQNQAQDAQVREFAERMVTEHGMLGDSLQALVQQQNIAPAPSPMVSRLQTETQAAVQRMQGLNGPEFDRAYVQDMVESHQMTLNALDTRLIPAAQTPQLRTALQERVRPAVADHLRRIQQIQSSVGLQ